MKHKTAELDGRMLDYAVALAEGWTTRGTGEPIDDPAEWAEPPGEFGSQRGVAAPPAFSTAWQHGGQITDRERISVSQYDRAPVQWFADVDGCWGHDYRPGLFTALGPTPLIAAMRAFVASKLGEEVEIP